MDGDVVIYEVELEERHTKSPTKSPFRWVCGLFFLLFPALTFLCAVINRADEIGDFSLQVQCEYEAADLMRAANLRSLYATTPPPVVALGSFRVLMRIAQGNKTGLSRLRAAEGHPNRAFVLLDASFTSFFPEDQLPLSLPLREAAYVEVAIAQPPPDPTLSLRVRDCFAYPASRHSVWTLLYDGWVSAVCMQGMHAGMLARLQFLLFSSLCRCPNPLDNMRSSVPVDNQGKTASHSQVRRFDVKTFAFVDPHTGHPSMEEVGQPRPGVSR